MTLKDMLREYEPTIPFDQLIISVNKIFHLYEADYYNQRHPGVNQQLLLKLLYTCRKVSRVRASTYLADTSVDLKTSLTMLQSKHHMISNIQSTAAYSYV